MQIKKKRKERKTMRRTHNRFSIKWITAQFNSLALNDYSDIKHAASSNEKLWVTFFISQIHNACGTIFEWKRVFANVSLATSRPPPTPPPPAHINYNLKPLMPTQMRHTCVFYCVKYARGRWIIKSYSPYLTYTISPHIMCKAYVRSFQFFVLFVRALPHYILYPFLYESLIHYACLMNIHSIPSAST